MDRTSTLTVRLSGYELRRVRRDAQSHDMTVSEYVRLKLLNIRPARETEDR